MGRRRILSETFEEQLRQYVTAGQIPEGFELLTATLKDDVRQFVRKRVEDQQIQEDLAQEIWIAARMGLDRFRLDAHPRSWLLAIAYRKIADYYRSRGRTPEFTFASSSKLALSLKPQTRPSSKIHRRQQAEALRKAMTSLSQADQELLHMRFVDELRPHEIAKIFGDGLKPNTVSQRIVAAVRRLRKKLRACPDFRYS